MARSALIKMIKFDNSLPRRLALKYMVFRWFIDHNCLFVEGDKKVARKPENWKKSNEFALYIGAHQLTLMFTTDKKNVKRRCMMIYLIYQKDPTTITSDITRVVAAYFETLPKTYTDTNKPTRPDYNCTNYYNKLFHQMTMEMYGDILKPLTFNYPIRDIPRQLDLFEDMEFE